MRSQRVGYLTFSETLSFTLTRSSDFNEEHTSLSLNIYRAWSTEIDFH